MARTAWPLLLLPVIAVTAVGCGGSSASSSASPTAGSLVVQVEPGTSTNREMQLQHQIDAQVGRDISGDFSSDSGSGRPMLIGFATKPTPAEMAVIERQILGMKDVRSVALRRGQTQLG